MTAAIESIELPRPSNRKTEEIRILSVRQPYASAFFDSRTNRRKFVENRTWVPPGGYRGLLFIHASSLDRRPSPAALSAYDPAAADSILDLWDDPPAIGLPVGQIIGCVNLWSIIPGETLELLSLVKQSAKSLPRDVAACLRPSERDGFLERWKAEHRSLSGITEEQFLTHWSGPECWLVDQPRLLREPIKCGGKLNLWKLQVPADRLA